jgi:hypothetical protein
VPDDAAGDLTGETSVLIYDDMVRHPARVLRAPAAGEGAAAVA